MLLSRLAENVYWAGRYLERAEDTARLVKVHTEMFMDMPSHASLGWTPLLALTGAADAYADHLEIAGDGDSLEVQIVSFMVTSRSNPSSVLSCIDSARNNLRSVRALIPRSGWEQANRLQMWSRDTEHRAVPRRTRTEWADAVIRRCQTLTGLLDGQMSQDQAYAFLLAGRHLERADMTTRVLDVQAAVLLDEVRDAERAYADVTWMSVLKSLSAIQMFRRVAAAGVSGSRALNFLLTDRQFPRSVAHCLNRLDGNLRELPNHAGAARALDDARRRIDDAALDASLKVMAPTELHDFMDRLQADIAEVHLQATTAWFTPEEPSTPAADVDDAADTVPAAAAAPAGSSQTQTQSQT